MDLETQSFQLDEPIDRKFCREAKHRKTFDAFLEVFQSLDQGPSERPLFGFQGPKQNLVQ